MRHPLLGSSDSSNFPVLDRPSATLKHFAPPIMAHAIVAQVQWPPSDWPKIGGGVHTFGVASMLMFSSHHWRTANLFLETEVASKLVCAR